MAKVKLSGISVFERYENKYLLNKYQSQNLLSRLNGAITQDQYGKHTICTMYYDTDDFAVIRRCLEKPKFREKLRLRSYGVPSADKTVYLELKKKIASVTYKRRIPLPLNEANNYIEKGKTPAYDDQLAKQIFGEIDWYINNQTLNSKAVICYDRVAMFANNDPNLRLTIDANIRWRDYDLSLEKGDHGSLLLPPSTYLLEIKTLNALPLWLTNVLSDLKIYPTSFSKYGTVYTQYLGRKEQIRYAV